MEAMIDIALLVGKGAEGINALHRVLNLMSRLSTQKSISGSRPTLSCCLGMLEIACFCTFGGKKLSSTRSALAEDRWNSSTAR